MRLTTLSMAVLASSAAAIPHRRHGHPHPVRRDADVVTEYIVETDMAVLYVDQNGNPVSTSAAPADAPAATDQAVNVADDGPPNGRPSYPDNQGDWPPQPMPTTSPQDSTSEAPPPPPPETTQAPPASSAPAPDTYPAPPSSGSAPDTSSAAPPQSAPPTYGDDDEDLAGWSIAWAPYRADNSCKSKSEVDADIDGLSKYAMIRIYGTDCNQVPLVVDAAKRNNLKVFAGIWDVDNAAAEAQLLIDGVRGDWSVIHTVSVGNEVIARGGSPSSIVNGINTAKPLLRGAGYEGPITTVDVWVTIIEHLTDKSNGLCDSIDYVAVNLHPFFDGGKTAEEAGQWVADMAPTVAQRSKCHEDKDVVVTESGWPSQGLPNMKAVPGPENQRTVVRGLKSAYASNKTSLILFSAYDEPWKEDNEWGVEHYWGIDGTAPSAR